LIVFTTLSLHLKTLLIVIFSIRRPSNLLFLKNEVIFLNYLVTILKIFCWGWRLAFILNWLSYIHAIIKNILIVIAVIWKYTYILAQSRAVTLTYSSSCFKIVNFIQLNSWFFNHIFISCVCLFATWSLIVIGKRIVIIILELALINWKILA